ncbi:MAG: gamma-glutamyl-gamma-aminobutyrate hydrolase family protein, partial [Planctomycetota bacterium]
MAKPLIGVTTGRRNHYAAQGRRQTSTIGCGFEYVDSVVRSGGAPVLIARTGDKEAVAAAMATVDGLLLSGGGDVVSLNYGEESHPKAVYQDPIRDRMELEAVRIAVERGIPILGICRGIQSLNVGLGGTLVQDVPSQVEGAVQHYTCERET